MSQTSVPALSPLQCVLLFHSVPHIGEKSLARLLRALSQGRLNPETCLALDAEVWRTEYELDPRSIAYLGSHRESLVAQSAELARLPRRFPLHILTLESAAYPARLEQHDAAPPPLLYAFGNLALLQPSIPDRFTFTIAVSNGASSASLTRMDEIATELVQQGGIPVTGHDRPPYKRLALAAQRRWKPVLYVLDRGLREALGPDFDRPPFSAARIRAVTFDTERDLALSPFRLDDHGLGANNRRRDQMVFALADVVVAGDVRAGGMMMEECLRARNQGRPVYIMEGGRDGNDALRAADCPALPADLDTLWPLTKR